MENPKRRKTCKMNDNKHIVSVLNIESLPNEIFMNNLVKFCISSNYVPVPVLFYLYVMYILYRLQALVACAHVFFLGG